MVSSKCQETGTLDFKAEVPKTPKNCFVQRICIKTKLFNHTEFEMRFFLFFFFHVFSTSSDPLLWFTPTFQVYFDAEFRKGGGVGWKCKQAVKGAQGGCFRVVKPDFWYRLEIAGFGGPESLEMLEKSDFKPFLPNSGVLKTTLGGCMGGDDQNPIFPKTLHKAILRVWKHLSSSALKRNPDFPLWY